MIVFVIMFGSPQDVSPVDFDGKAIRFPFAVIETQYIGTPHQSSKTTHACIVVQASKSVLAIWDVFGSSMVKALYQVAKEHLVALLKESGRIESNIALPINTDTHNGPCPFDIALIEEPEGAVINLEVNRPIGFL